MTTNGTPPPRDLPAGLAEVFDFARWRRLTELAIKRGEALLAQAEDAVLQAQEAMLERERELDVLRRALTLQPQEGSSLPENPALPPLPPPPPAPVVVELPPPPEFVQGSRVGGGVGYRAGMYLLEVIRVRGDGTLSRAQAALACSGWKPGTLRDGLRRLQDDGLLERYGRGLYRLTQAGRDLCADGPVPTVLLPLTDPGREDDLPPPVRPVAHWVRERVVVEYGKDEAATLVPHPEENGALARR